MKNSFNDLFERYPLLMSSKERIERALQLFIETFESGGKIVTAGNGGSASDAEHICGELMKGFMQKRHINNAGLKDKFAGFGDEGKYLSENLQMALPCISLTSHTALNTAVANDIDPDLMFAQQLFALGRKGDVFIGISTSGNAENLKYAFMTASAIGMKSVLLTGNRHGICEKFADVSVAVDESETFRIQELHLPVYHWWCQMTEEHFYGR